MSDLHLHEVKHPNKDAKAAFEALVGLDAQKEQLVEELLLLLDPSRIEKWRKKHHHKGLPILDTLARGAPLVMLSGEVGCGKTALATSVATPIAERLDAQVTCLETPSNVRGVGLVGDVSNRITTAFSMAKGKLSGSTRYGLLVIDEADDLATSRAQLQAHHEDRAGLNVLVKQIDTLARTAPGLAVILITNRVTVLDPAVRRRVALHLTFDRPGREARKALFTAILRGTSATDRDLDELVRKSEHKDVPYSSSDIMHRVARAALTRARVADAPLTPALVLEVLAHVEPSPLVEDAKVV
jgi:SpoVK/Ycf46/Vps4 family AAA+-type ATPase